MISNENDELCPRGYQDAIMGPSRKWVHERSFAEDLVSRWAKSIIEIRKKNFSEVVTYG